MQSLQIEYELAGMAEWTEEDYVDFDPTDYVDNPVALARHMKITPSYISNWNMPPGSR